MAAVMALSAAVSAFMAFSMAMALMFSVMVVARCILVIFESA